MATMNIFTGTFKRSNDMVMSYLYHVTAEVHIFIPPSASLETKIFSNIFTKTLHFWSWWLSLAWLLTNGDMSYKWPLSPPCNIIDFRAHNANTSVPMSVVIWLVNVMDKRNGGQTVHTAITATMTVSLIQVMHVWGSHLMTVAIYINYMGIATGSIFWICGRLVLVTVYSICKKDKWLQPTLGIS
jgi:hypothetical protein